MWSRLFWCCGLMSVIAIAVSASGPNALGASTASWLFGSDPTVDDCNGKAKESFDCPESSQLPGVLCGPAQYELPRTEQPGTTLTTRYNNLVRQCNLTLAGCPGQMANYWTLDDGTINCHQVKSSIEGE